MVALFSLYIPKKKIKAVSALNVQMDVYASNNTLKEKKCLKPKTNCLTTIKDSSFLSNKKKNNKEAKKGNEEERITMNNSWKSFKNFILKPFANKFESHLTSVEGKKYCKINKSSSPNSCIYKIPNSSFCNSKDNKLLLPIPVRRTILDGPRGPTKVTKNEININVSVGLTPHNNNPQTHKINDEFFLYNKNVLYDLNEVETSVNPIELLTTSTLVRLVNLCTTLF